jgi:hypothetical protein
MEHPLSLADALSWYINGSGLPPGSSPARVPVAYQPHADRASGCVNLTIWLWIPVTCPVDGQGIRARWETQAKASFVVRACSRRDRPLTVYCRNADWIRERPTMETAKVVRCEVRPNNPCDDNSRRRGLVSSSPSECASTPQHREGKHSSYTNARHVRIMPYGRWCVTRCAPDGSRRNGSWVCTRTTTSPSEPIALGTTCR